MATDTNVRLFTFDLVSPEALLFSQPVEMVVIPGEAGDMGVLAGHAPVVSTLRPGLIEVHQPGHGLRRLFVAGGIAEVNPQSCTVLADEALDLCEVNHGDAAARLQEARSALAQAQSEGGELAIRAADKELAVAEALALVVG